jgi:TonB family protein
MRNTQLTHSANHTFFSINKVFFQPIFSVFLFLTSFGLFGQEAVDTTVYSYASTMPIPMLNSCQPAQHPTWSIDSLRACAESEFISLVSRNIQYPQEAREKNIQGMVVASYIVEKNGKISNLSVLKEIGGGCGNEALRVLDALNEAGLRFIPAQNEGKIVRLRMNVPLKFRLEEAKPYTLNAVGDSIYNIVDTQVQFKGGLDSMANYIVNRLEYPKNWKDSCKTGIIELSLLIFQDGSLMVDNQLDFSNLGGDFQFNAIRLANRSIGKWIPATYQGKNVITSYPFRVPFKSDLKTCTTTNASFEKALLLSDEAFVLADTGKEEETIAKLSEAIKLDPKNTELRYYRANAYFQLNRKEEACADFTSIKTQLGMTWFEGLGRIICGF